MQALNPGPLNQPMLEVDIMRISYEHLDLKKYFIGSMLSLITGRTLTYPFVYAKTLHQTLSTGSHSLSCTELVRASIQKEGPRALYKGFPAYLCGMLPSHVGHIYTFELVRGMLFLGSEHLEVAVASFSASVASVFIATPSDIISQRMMVRGGPQKNNTLFGTVNNILKTDGFAGFYKGFAPALSTCVVSSVIWWQTYYHLKKFLCSKTSENPTRSEFMTVQAISGGASSLLSTILINPLDVIKTRLQVLNTKSWSSTLSHLIKTQGFSWATRGLAPRLIAAAPVSAATLSLYEEVKRLSVKPNIQLRYNA